MVTPIYALILDMDGVIIASNLIHAEAWRRYLGGFNLQVDGIGPLMHGKRNDEIVRAIFGEETAEDVVFAHGAAKERLYREMMLPVIERQLIGGLRDFLERHKDMPIGIGTNAEPANVDFVLDNAGLRKYFRVAIHGHMVQEPKPRPEIYLRVAKELGFQPENCVVFEDSLTGIAAARAAGTQVVGVQSTPVNLSGVDLIIQDFADPLLEPWLAQRLSCTPQ